MPELPEVEVLVRHLRPQLSGKIIRQVEVRRERVLRPTAISSFTRALRGAKFVGLTRRGKYMLFSLQRNGKGLSTLVGHLGMTGRMYLSSAKTSPPKHAAVILNLGRQNFVFEDTRYFGRLTLDTSLVDGLGVEPLGDEFAADHLAAALKRTTQPIKVKLLDQSLISGVGNIYASEALFRACISPMKAARALTTIEVERLWSAIRDVLNDAIRSGSTVPLDFSGQNAMDRLFYFGTEPGKTQSYEERLQVYDRAGKPCYVCRSPVRRLVQGGRSTFFCPHCQPRHPRIARASLRQAADH